MTIDSAVVGRESVAVVGREKSVSLGGEYALFLRKTAGQTSKRTKCKKWNARTRNRCVAGAQKMILAA